MVNVYFQTSVMFYTLCSRHEMLTTSE